MKGAGWVTVEFYKKGNLLKVTMSNGTSGLVIQSQTAFYSPGTLLFPGFEAGTGPAHNEHRVRNINIDVLDSSDCAGYLPPLTLEQARAEIVTACGDVGQCPDRTSYTNCVDATVSSLEGQSRITPDIADLLQLEAQYAMSFCDGYQQCVTVINPTQLATDKYDEGFAAGVLSVDVAGIEATARALGYSEGYADGDAAGHANGVTEGYSSGFDAGSAHGYSVGFEAGELQGHANGVTEGYSTGFDAGSAHGYSVGFDAGTAQGHAAGVQEGYASGFTDGRSAGLLEGSQVAYQQGFTDGLNQGTADGFAAGNAAGLSAGYQSGYQDGSAAGRAAGYNDGFSAGSSSGYSSGYADGNTAGYNSGYNAGNSDGYDTGYEAGQTAGDSAGYNRGYAAGFEAGQDDAPACTMERLILERRALLEEACGNGRFKNRGQFVSCVTRYIKDHNWKADYWDSIKDMFVRDAGGRWGDDQCRSDRNDRNDRNDRR
jgi:flagellar biosynthesis/type III secretory pathway protein FliH